MNVQSVITRIYRVKESFTCGLGAFTRGDLVYEDHPVVKEYPHLVESDVLDLQDLQEFPPELVAQQQYKRVPAPASPPSWQPRIIPGGTP
jgi:hypothetical protein